MKGTEGRESEVDLYRELKKRVADYLRSLQNVGFANYELMKIKKAPESEEELMQALDTILASSKELNYILEEASDSIFVCDADGVAIRVNKKFQRMTHLKRSDVLGAKMSELDANGSFRPSVCHLTIKEGRQVSVLQEIGDVSGMAVTGVPVYDERGELFRIITNAVKIDEVAPIAEYFNGKKKKGDSVPDEKLEIVAESREMRQVLSMADMVRDTESNILITGETGVGKGVLVRYIHETGNRSDMPLISINCGAIPENLLESELFGYESGAFTGADRHGKPGLIELAEGGTLFLDEISELPLMLQVKILHFLQTKKLMRVGGTKEISIDTRVIAASNKNLEKEVEKGNFRSDLFYRINVIPIYIPPLRERRDDLMAIAEHFLAFYNGKYRKSVVFTDDMKEYIFSHKWPGNVRELENYIERMVVISAPEERDKGKASDAAGVATGDGVEAGVPQAGAGTDGMVTAEAADSLGDIIEKTERDAIIEAYEKYGSSYKVAEALGISQSTAYRRIKKFIKDAEK